MIMPAPRCSRACFLVGGLPPRTCFYVSTFSTPSGSHSCFYVWATAIQPHRGRRRSKYKIDAVLPAIRPNCGRPDVKTRAGATGAKKAAHVKTRTGRKAAHEKTRTGAHWSEHLCKNTTFSFARGARDDKTRGRPPPRSCFYVCGAKTSYFGLGAKNLVFWFRVWEPKTSRFCSASDNQKLRVLGCRDKHAKTRAGRRPGPPGAKTTKTFKN